MIKPGTGGTVTTACQEIPESSPRYLYFIACCHVCQKLLVDASLRDLARRRAEDDAASATNAFIAICALVVIALSAIMAL